MNSPSLPFEASTNPETWRRRERTILVFAALVPLLYALDWFALGHWSPTPLVVRLVWSAQLLLYMVLCRTLGPRWEQRLANVNSIATCCCFLTLIYVTGAQHSPYLHLLPSLPLIIALIQPRDGWPALLSGITCTLGTVLMLLSLGWPMAALGWALLTGSATFFGVYGAAQYRKAQEAEHAVRLERARRESLEKLALAERQRAQTEKLATVGRLAAGVVHEINNPLAFVRSNLEFLRTEVLRQSLPQEAHAELSEVFEETRQGVERIRQIVSDLRGFSHVDMEEPTACALADVVTDASRLAGVRLKHVARLTVALPPELPDVFAIRRRLAQVVLNLLVNAGDALEEARVPGGEVRVTGVAEGARVALLVEDNGPGFPPEVMPHLFESFFTTKGPDKGTGLGLALSRELVERFGGTLVAENRPEGGARLRLELPVHAPPPAPGG
ncbi:sensor histidine kinase [Cystobacter ferrugineus]|uniref:histidine kinase n=1 Tax=Cystobacter ferrugineus TaxID=83449 RepID=A0A1L9B2V5_9BACT|nr:ATP-binding protein [Cystobacter ferrugineus]OJH36605.1 two-component sensor histidine kinase [Cystobacter ferrugineus]